MKIRERENGDLEIQRQSHISPKIQECIIIPSKCVDELADIMNRRSCENANKREKGYGEE